MSNHIQLTAKPLESGEKFVSETVILQGVNSMRGWVYCNENGSLGIFQAFNRKGPYRKIYDVPVNKEELLTYNVPVYSRFGLIVFVQGLVGSSDLEIVLFLSDAPGEIAGTRQATELS